MPPKNVFLIGLTDTDLARLHCIRNADRYVFHGALVFDSDPLEKDMEILGPPVNERQRAPPLRTSRRSSSHYPRH